MPDPEETGGLLRKAVEKRKLLGKETMVERYSRAHGNVHGMINVLNPLTAEAELRTIIALKGNELGAVKVGRFAPSDFYSGQCNHAVDLSSMMSASEAGVVVNTDPRSPEFDHLSMEGGITDLAGFRNHSILMARKLSLDTYTVCLESDLGTTIRNLELLLRVGRGEDPDFIGRFMKRPRLRDLAGYPVCWAVGLGILGYGARAKNLNMMPTLAMAGIITIMGVLGHLRRQDYYLKAVLRVAGNDHKAQIDMLGEHVSRIEEARRVFASESESLSDTLIPYMEKQVWSGN